MLLRLLPEEMRGRFGADMEELFAVRLQGARGSLPRTAKVWVKAVVDVVVQAISIRLENRERGVWKMGAILQDLRASLRSLTKSPGFTLAAVATLALGIGASTATFSVVHAVLLEELPFEEPDRLVVVWPEVNANKAMVLMAEERMRSLAGVSGMNAGWTLTLTGVGEPEELTGMMVSPHYFDLLGVSPALGRSFEPTADLPGEAGVAILSHDLWIRAFGGDPSVVGRMIDLGGAEYTSRRVIGVMPPGVDELVYDVDLWIPLEGDRSLGLQDDETWYVNQRIARLAPGATLEQANSEVAAYAAAVQQELPGHFSEEEARSATVQPVQDYLTRDVRAAVWVTLAAVGLVLLIGCFNVANLLLARGDGQARDLAVRAALGAGRTRLTRMLLAEAAVIGLVGGVGGIVLASSLAGVIARQAPQTLPGIAAVTVNGPVLLFALAVTAASVVAAGVVPAMRVGRVRATAALSGASRSRSGRAVGRVAPLLVGSQIALAVVVSVASGLMIRSLSTLLAVDPGIEGEGVLVFKPTPPTGRYPDGLAFFDYYNRVSEAVAALPNVEAVGGIHLLPGRTSNWSFPTFPEGFTQPAGAPRPTVNFRAVRGRYFELTRIRLVAGRAVDDTDRADTEPVVVVNERFVEEFWPGQDPLGRTLAFLSPSGTRYRVVGVVADVHQHGRTIEPQSEMYLSHAQVPWNQMGMWMMARVRTGDPEAMTRAVHEAIWSVDPDVPVSGTAHLADVLDESTGRTRFLTLLLSSFGLLALLLCAVGIFGVTAYTSGRRKPEFGVRLALGSSRSSVVLSGISRSFGPVAFGLVAGVAGAAGGARLLRSVLYGVEPYDVPTFSAVITILVLTAVLAAAIPAWRASRVDPVVVLGSE